MKVGDLVKFESKFWQQEGLKEYANPGIVIATITHYQPGRHRILWADGTFTTEHENLLSSVEEK